MKTKEETIAGLLTKYRMTYSLSDEGGVNRLFGLKDLCDKFIAEDLVMLEVGSFAGVSSELFANYCKQLYCVDIWKEYSEINQENLNNGEKQFDEMIERYDNIVKVKLPSKEASETFEDGFFDVIYIDAAHDYTNVLIDISSWLPKLKKGGVMAGHDYVTLPGVRRAVDECFNNVHTFSDSSWAVIVD